jgi:hypothetical protein
VTPNGTLSGDFVETRHGDSGLWPRMTLKSVTKEADKIKPIETMLSRPLSAFKSQGKRSKSQPDGSTFGYQYSLVAENYKERR